MRAHTCAVHVPRWQMKSCSLCNTWALIQKNTSSAAQHRTDLEYLLSSHCAKCLPCKFNLYSTLWEGYPCSTFKENEAEGVRVAPWVSVMKRQSPNSSPVSDPRRLSRPISMHRGISVINYIVCGASCPARVSTALEGGENWKPQEIPKCQHQGTFQEIPSPPGIRKEQGAGWEVPGRM